MKRNARGQKNDADIIRKYFDRDETAVDDTSEKYGRLIYSVCFGILRDRAASEECQNAVLSAVWNRIPPDCPDNLRNYLCMVARSSAIDRLRKDHRKKRISSGIVDALDDYGDLFEDDFDTSAELETKEETQILEMDELYTYIKKNRIKSEYGLLSIGTRSVLLHLKSEMAAERR